MNDRKYVIYKRIMKRDPKAIDEIESLEEAKEIISLMIGNLFIHREVYRINQEVINSIDKSKFKNILN